MHGAGFAKESVEDNTKVNIVCPGNFFDGPLLRDPDCGLFVLYLNTGKVLLEKFGFTTENIYQKAAALLGYRDFLLLNIPECVNSMRLRCSSLASDFQQYELFRL